MTHSEAPSKDHVLQFWFDEIGKKRWFNSSKELDRQIEERFGALHAQASRCELYHWRSDPEGALAEIIVLDQFSRNMYRNTAAAFACDSQALALAQVMVAAGQDQALPADRRRFVYMPYMHSESSMIHELAVELFSQPGLEDNLRFELAHKAIVDRFGRYPHRNDALGRTSSDEETAFLKEPGSSF